MIKRNCTTELCVDLKTMLLSDRRMRQGVPYSGVITRQDEQNMTFIESLKRVPSNKSNTHKLMRDGNWLSLSRSESGKYFIGVRSLPVEIDAAQLMSEMVSDINRIIHLIEKEA